MPVSSTSNKPTIWAKAKEHLRILGRSTSAASVKRVVDAALRENPNINPKKMTQRDIDRFIISNNALGLPPAGKAPTPTPPPIQPPLPPALTITGPSQTGVIDRFGRPQRGGGQGIHTRPV